MTRSNWKIMNTLTRNTFITKKYKIFNSNFIILKDFIGFIFFVYTGNKFKKIVISEDLVGILLSTLIFTRYNNGSIHINKKKKKKKKIKWEI